MRMLLKDQDITHDEYNEAATKYQEKKSHETSGVHPPTANDDKKVNDILNMYLKKLNLGDFQVNVRFLLSSVCFFFTNKRFIWVNIFLEW